MQTIFDGHNDLLLRLWNGQRAGRDPLTEFQHMGGPGHIDLEKAKAGGLVGGFCAIFVPPSPGSGMRVRAGGKVPTAPVPPLDRAEALDATLAMASIALRLHEAGHWRLCRSRAELDGAFADNTFAAILHVEGCEAIGEDLAALDVLHAAGLRSLGPVWSRDNIFGHGVPFAYPSSPDTGPGLTEAGKALVRACNRLGILVDLSHITEKGFWDVAALSDRPLVATHSNVHAITPSSRNLTDEQLAAVRESGGVVGLNFAVAFLREDGQERADTGIGTMVRHIEHLVDKVGIDGVAIGSDFDGAMIPSEIGSAAGLQNLVQGLSEAGYAGEDLEKICRRNWLRVLDRTWL